MRFFGIAIAAVASTLLFTPNASAQQWPSPADVGNLLQQAANAAGNAATCPTIEVAPNVRVPVCPNSLPKPPPGVVIPEAVFPAVNVLPAVDLRTRGLDGPVMNQEQTGVCYAFAITDVLDNSLRRQGRAEVLSPLHLVASGGFSSIFNSTPGEALDAEVSWPYDPRKACKFETGRDACEHAYGLQTNTWQSDPVLVSERQRARTLGIATIQRATTLSRDPVGGIVNALSLGRSTYLVIGIDSTAWGYSGVKSGVLRDYTTADRGDHAVAVVGYRQAGVERQFLLHNSWGTSWGDHGFVWISESTMKKHLTAAYLVEAVPSGASPIPTQPLPAQPLPFPGFPALPALPGLVVPNAIPALPAWPWPQRA